MDAAAFRAEFPVLEHTAYLNAGTCGPLPRAAVAALEEAARHALAEGRASGYYERFAAVREELRAAYAAALGAESAEVAVTTSTSEGIVRVLLGLDLKAGDEVLTAEVEHPGLQGPLAAARRRLGITIREVPLAHIADEVGPNTRLLACSHVGWSTGELAPDLRGVEVPVLLDGAQGLGALAFDVRALGCAFYAGSGQKWMCGPVGSGALWIDPAWREQVLAAAPTYVNLEVPADGLESLPWSDGRAHDATAMALETAEAALAAARVLAAAGYDTISTRARALAAEVAATLAEARREVAPRGDSTLVSWRSEDPAAEVARLREAGVVVRSFPGLPWVRASVGAWNDQSDVERLVAGASAS